MKFIYLLPPALLLSGCALADMVLQNKKVLDEAGDIAEGFGPAGYLISGGLGLAVSLSKWYKHKGTAEELISVVQKAKAELPPESKKIFTDALHKHMASKVKKYVSDIKKKI